MFNLDYLFCHVDDFCQQFEPQWQQKLISHGAVQRVRTKSLCLSEIMTILIAFHQNHYRNFKHFYLNHVQQYWTSAFPKLPSYQRFVQWIPSTIIPLCVYLKHCFGNCTGISFIDSTKIQVCHNRRIRQHKVFKNLAQRGKTSVDWFFGFKLHLVVNELGEIVNMSLTPGNVDDRKPVVDLLKELWGKVFGDRGYVSQKLATKLLKDFGIEFFAKPRRNMKNKLMRLHDKLLSRKRAIVETINDQLKNISQIEHSRHRSPINFCVNILCGLIAYCHQPKKPHLSLEWILPQSA
ncbi:IS982 family transposase [Cyanobacterium sp. Dongsha4]|uniref:IS982 family transposase n=1 Tax=Cyanobacterium sp. DS4 TaxID=2878255 RepID=UPI001C3E9E70|nr:IS982 family transposase [Cyanobacterium sp. Dongsha4]MBV5262372.1 IS982 family transposase [Synechococcus moorigangaii CMS01]WVK99296.1 IS982 family transposase [Cyanobacterium sp. Dongsha4]WVK99651.1 IS982 family transposase [Cyanobacterium sp. Dongsha4]WVK99929.1 IS982 family transposase [Cyanobacterium sp. Dongsha4]WVK99962.1 IS982 family transposase [Cyanobacterium sp. Dongsha4]